MSNINSRISRDSMLVTWRCHSAFVTVRVVIALSDRVCCRIRRYGIEPAKSGFRVGGLSGQVDGDWRVDRWDGADRWHGGDMDY
jgi:hypothetical protein